MSDGAKGAPSVRRAEALCGSTAIWLRCLLFSVLLGHAAGALAYATADVQITNVSPVQLFRLVGTEIDTTVAPAEPPTSLGSGFNYIGLYPITGGYAVGYSFDYAISVSDSG